MTTKTRGEDRLDRRAMTENGTWRHQDRGFLVYDRHELEALDYFATRPSKGAVIVPTPAAGAYP